MAFGVALTATGRGAIRIYCCADAGRRRAHPFRNPIILDIESRFTALVQLASCSFRRPIEELRARNPYKKYSPGTAATTKEIISSKRREKPIYMQLVS